MNFTNLIFKPSQEDRLELFGIEVFFLSLHCISIKLKS